MTEIVSGADVRQALQAGLWKALVDDSDHAAMRATCRDARDMADELQDSAVLPVGPGTWDSAAAIAAYHRRLGAVQSLHVRYSSGEADDERAAQFVEAYRAALGAALPADSCTITMPSTRQLGTSFAEVLLQRVVPRVERLDMALGSYRNLAQLLTLLLAPAHTPLRLRLQSMRPCTHLRSLRLLPAAGDDTRGPGGVCVGLNFDSVGRSDGGGVLQALCNLTRLHTLSGPWAMGRSELKHLCSALPGLTSLGFQQLDLGGASGACISRQLHTLAGWKHSAFGEVTRATSQSRCDHHWHLLDSSASRISAVCNLHSSFPVLHQLLSVVLESDKSGYPIGTAAQELATATSVVQRFAACAESWAWEAFSTCRVKLEAVQGLAQDSLAAMQHMVVDLGGLEPADAGAYLRCLVAAAPNITSLAVRYELRGCPAEALVAMLKPLCRAPCMHTLHLKELWRYDQHLIGQPVLRLAEVVRRLARPGAEGECCRALKRARMVGVGPDALQACRRALADDGVDVSLDACVG